MLSFAISCSSRSCAYLLTGVAQVGPEERAVVRRFGEVVARPGAGAVGRPAVGHRPRRPRAGAHGAQLRVGYDPETASRRHGTPAGQFLTGDQNLVNVQLVLDYAIGETDADLDDYVIHRERVDATLARIAEAAAAEWSRGAASISVLLTGNAALPAWVMDRLGERLPGMRLGVRVQRVSVAVSGPPDEVRAAFEAVTQAQTGIRTREFQALQERDQRERQAGCDCGTSLRQEAEEYPRFAAASRAQADADGVPP